MFQVSVMCVWPCLLCQKKKSEPYDAPIRIYGRKSVQSMIFEKSSLKMKNLIVQIMLIRADFEWKLFFKCHWKNLYTSYEHNQGIHKVCLTSLIMSVKKLESYDMSNVIYLEKRVGGEKTCVFFPPVSNIHLSSYDVVRSGYAVKN